MKFVLITAWALFPGCLLAEVDFQHPTRDYIFLDGDWDIYYEASMEKANLRLAKESVAKLKKTLRAIEKSLPSGSLPELQTLNIFLMWGEASPNGGKKSGMRFVRRGETTNRPHYDSRWEHSVVIYSAENLMYLTDMWAKKALMHEFAHAWHITHWPEKYSEIVIPWKNAISKNLYTNVDDYKDRVIESAYARKNHLEYFAELSAMYFVGGNYYPYNKEQLHSYDPDGTEMVKKLWKEK